MADNDSGGGFGDVISQADLVASFLAEARASVGRLRALVTVLDTDPDGVATRRAALRHEAHNLKGLSGFYDFPTLMALAGALEDAAQPQSLGCKPPANLAVLVTAMESILDEGVDPRTAV